MLGRLLDQANDLIAFAVLGLFFGLLRVWAMPGVQSVFTYLASVGASVPVGTIVGALCLEHGYGDITSISFASLSSLVAHDLITAIVRNKEFLGSLLKRAAENITDKLTK